MAPPFAVAVVGVYLALGAWFAGTARVRDYEERPGMDLLVRVIVMLAWPLFVEDWRPPEA